MSNDETSEDKELYADIEEESQAFKAEEQKAVIESASQVAIEKQSQATAANPHEEDEEEVESFEGEGDFDYEQDPVENAFDLEKGDPLKGQRKREVRGGGLPSSNQVGSIKEFFNTEVVYRFDILNEKERNDLKGAYRFDLISGGRISDSWTLSIDQELKSENVKNDADLVVEVEESDFLNLVNGYINPQLAVLANKILFQGDIGALFRINSIIYPGD